MIRIAVAAHTLGVHPDTLRALEARGLFRAQRDHAGHRRYSPGDITRLHALLFPPSGCGSAVPAAQSLPDGPTP